MSLSVASNFYMSNIIPDSSVMSIFMSNKAKNEFTDFRKNT